MDLGALRIFTAKEAAPTDRKYHKPWEFWCRNNRPTWTAYDNTGSLPLKYEYKYRSTIPVPFSNRVLGEALPSKIQTLSLS